MSHKSVVCNNHRNTDHTQQLNYFKALIAGEKAISSTEVMHRYQISSTTSIFRSKAVLIKNDYWIIKPVKSRSKTRFMPIGWRLSSLQNNKTMNKYNLTWIAFANKKRCRLTKAINTLVVISWRKLNVVLFYSYHPGQLHEIIIWPNIKFFWIAHERQYIFFHLFYISWRETLNEFLLE